MRPRTSLLALSLLVAACGGTSDAPTRASSSAPAAPVASPAATTVAGVRATLAKGNAADAAKEAEALVTAHPEDDEAWDLLEICAMRAGVEGAMLDRFAADKALGGRTERHHTLRGVLAVRAGRFGDAQNAANALAAEAPGAAAAIAFWAVEAGAPAPDLGPGLASLLAARDGETSIGPDAAALTGWRIAAVRAHLLLARGNRVGALAELSNVGESGAVARIAVASLRAAAAADASSALAAAEPAARAAAESGDNVGAAEILDAAVANVGVGWKSGALAELAESLRTAAKAGNDAPGASRLAAVVADAALRAGRPKLAFEAATDAQATPALKARAAWSAGLAAARLGESGAVGAASAQVAEPRATALRGLAEALDGSGVLPTLTGLDPVDAAQVALGAAPFLRDPAPAYAAARGALATLTPPPAPLALEVEWAATRAAPTTAARRDGPPPTAAMIAETAARQLAAGGASSATLSAPHPQVAAWSALQSGEAGKGGDVGAWSRARAALAAGDVAAAEREYADAALAVPSWRVGPLAPVLVLDGATPLEIASSDVGRVASDAVGPTLSFHAAQHRRAAAELAWWAGGAPFPADVPVEARRAVFDAAARHRYASLAWLAGEPVDLAVTATALASAEATANLQRFQLPTVTSLRDGLQGGAVLSWLFRRDGSAQILGFSEKGAGIVELKPSQVADVVKWMVALDAGDPAVALGDRVRGFAVDPLASALGGVARIVVVTNSPSAPLPLGGLPEQIDGLRFLGSIRHFSSLTSIDAIVAARAAPAEVSATMLALCADESEAISVRGVFPDATTLVGPAATLAAWREGATKARYLYIGKLPSAGGGFKLADGVLTVRELGERRLGASSAAIDRGTDGLVGLARASALRRAGVDDVLVTHATDARLREFTVQKWWEGVNRRQGGARGLSEARAAAIRDVGTPEAARPSLWAGWGVVGRP